jgi:hypothetical protein
MHLLRTYIRIILSLQDVIVQYEANMSVTYTLIVHSHYIPSGQLIG